MAHNEELKEQYIGIDVGSEELWVAVGKRGTPTKVLATSDEVASLVKRLTRLQPKLIVMEATGGYETPIAASIAAAGLPLAIVNPRQVREFARAKNLQIKDDPTDAKLIAHFAEAVEPEARPLKDEDVREIDSLVRRRKQLQENEIAERNRLKTASHKRERESLEAHVEWLKRELKEIEKTLRQRIKNSPVWREKDKLLQSVPGVGPVLSMTLLATFPELGLLGRGPAASLAGVAPFKCDSGKLKGKRHIRGGRHDLRRALFCATRAAVERGYNPRLVEYFNRLRATGKPYKVAMVACMRKLLVILNTILATGVPWNGSA